MVTTDETRDREKRMREMLADELQGARLYDSLASLADTDAQAGTLRELAEAERRHARHWAELLADLSLLEKRGRLSWSDRVLLLIARFGGLGLVLARLRMSELEEIRRYSRDPDAAHLVDEEREHRQTLGRLGGLDDADQAITPAHRFSGADIATTFRAGLFGFNDGLVSNLSLMTGVAGAAVESNAVLIAGIAGWLAGASSMGAGEYISVRSQRELFENQIERERMELELDPEDEHRELIKHLPRTKGISRGGGNLASPMRSWPIHGSALDTHVREEFGIDPDDLGSPWRAAISSAFAFSIGAIVPVLPFLFGSGYGALAVAIGCVDCGDGAGGDADVGADRVGTRCSRRGAWCSSRGLRRGSRSGSARSIPVDL